MDSGSNVRGIPKSCVHKQDPGACFLYLEPEASQGVGNLKVDIFTKAPVWYSDVGGGTGGTRMVHRRQLFAKLLMLDAEELPASAENILASKTTSPHIRTFDQEPVN